MEDELIDYLQSPRFRDSLKIPRGVPLELRFLAQGEYNRNYLFRHPVTGQELVLRLNFGSQMHLSDQIGYEFMALQALRGSGRTPEPLFVDRERNLMVERFLPGHHLQYETELFSAAPCLADIHSVPIPPDSGLLFPPFPLDAILEECGQMVQTYRDSPLADRGKRRSIDCLLEKGRRIAEAYPKADFPVTIINTELNNTNFLVETTATGVFTRLVDWEKPVLGDPAQDLGHLLAPTTTFWKTDLILSEQQIREFVRAYVRAVAGRFDTDGLQERVNVFLPVTCLRGLTWCAMAWVDYQRDHGGLRNESTRKKLNQYLDDSFMDMIEARLDAV